MGLLFYGDFNSECIETGIKVVTADVKNQQKSAQVEQRQP